MDTHNDTTLDHGALIRELDALALHRHSAVRERAVLLRADMIEYSPADSVVMAQYLELQALIAHCRRVDREHARQRRNAVWSALRLLALVALFVAVPVIAAVLS